jgi:hypothetical protein
VQFLTDNHINVFNVELIKRYEPVIKKNNHAVIESAENEDEHKKIVQDLRKQASNQCKIAFELWQLKKTDVSAFNEKFKKLDPLEQIQYHDYASQFELIEARKKAEQK